MAHGSQLIAHSSWLMSCVFRFLTPFALSRPSFIHRTEFFDMYFSVFLCFLFHLASFPFVLAKNSFLRNIYSTILSTSVRFQCFRYSKQIDKFWNGLKMKIVFDINRRETLKSGEIATGFPIFTDKAHEMKVLIE